ncbi:inner membrane transport permease YbhR [Clostridium ragsdalei P11]|uniref:Inner membrane transport permease YbhR n=1 Tax=Clostridium ragsdalei P11 TaxID=1353534 RepID=A0A1A6AWA5_9CLOT|nr:ABC transporter permease [Clostridium ragsdalei]OBR94366.1 inner membrane transport permease YbhR [Clostridium ragsdalei P11]
MNTFSVAKRVTKQILGDRRSLALLFVAPIFVLYLLSIMLNSGIDKPNLEGINLPQTLMESLKNETNIVEVQDENKALDRVKNNVIDGLVKFENDKIIVTVEGSDMAASNSVKKAVSKAFNEYMHTSIASNPMLKQLGFRMIDSEYNYINGSENMTTFDTVAPLMMGFFIFFFVFLMAGVSFLRERISGTLDRLMATPIKRIEIVLGYFLGFGIFVMFQTLVIQLFMVYGLGITIKGSPILVLLVNVLLAAGSLTLGTLLSAFAKNEFQLFQFIPIVIVPQILFCGLFPLRETPIWVNVLSKIFPLTYGADALKGIVLRGYGLSKAYMDILILFGYALLFIVLNSLALKKYRRL